MTFQLAGKNYPQSNNLKPTKVDCILSKKILAASKNKIWKEFKLLAAFFHDSVT